MSAWPISIDDVDRNFVHEFFSYLALFADLGLIGFDYPVVAADRRLFLHSSP
jgi:hypothetical protein